MTEFRERHQKTEQKLPSDDERQKRHEKILVKLDRMQREDGYHTEPANWARRPRWRVWSLITAILLVLIYLAA